MKKLEQTYVAILYLAKSSIEIMIIDSPCVERVSLVCKFTVSRNSDLRHCLSCKKAWPV